MTQFSFQYIKKRQWQAPSRTAAWVYCWEQPRYPFARSYDSCLASRLPEFNPHHHHYYKGKVDKEAQSSTIYFNWWQHHSLNEKAKSVQRVQQQRQSHLIAQSLRVCIVLCFSTKRKHEGKLFPSVQYRLYKQCSQWGHSLKIWGNLQKKNIRNYGKILVLQYV